MPRTLLITTVSPYPKNVGKRVVLGGLCDWFIAHRRPGDFLVVSFDTLHDALPGAGAAPLSRPAAWRKLWNLLWFTWVLRSKSMQEALFWSPAARRQIDRVIADFEPAVVIYDTLRSGQYHRHLPAAQSCRAVLYLDDLFSVRYERMLAALARFPGLTIDALGNFVENIPRGLLRLYRSAPGLQRWLLQRERRLVARSEDRVPRSFDLALLINEHEVGRLSRRAALANVAALRPFLPAPPVTTARRWTGTPTFVFLGALNLPHNGVSLELFLETRFERLVAAVPHLRLLVIGGQPSPQLRELAARWSGHVELAGFVEDLDAQLAGCAGMLAPLLFGSGVKIKVIDALRLGVPVVATDVGAEGIATQGRGLIVENDLDAFGHQCRRLLDPAVNAAESAASLALFESHYSSHAVGANYRRLFSLPPTRED